MTPAPLSAHPSFSAKTPEELGAAVQQRLGARILRLSTERGGPSSGYRYTLQNSELWFCSYSTPTTLAFGAGDYLRVQFPHRGLAVTRTRGTSVAVGGSSACISSSEAEIDFGRDFQQVAWRIGRRELVRKFAAITGAPCERPLEFDAALDLSKPASSAMVSVLSSLLTCIDTLPEGSRTLLAQELEESLAVALLVGSSHSQRHRLEAPVSRASPRQVRLVEQHIEAHCDGPLRMEDLVAVSGSSARSLFRAFRESRGYTPMQFLLRCRLERARRLLADTAAHPRVTDVALSCGFTSVSHFSKAFSAACGETPSEFIRRQG